MSSNPPPASGGSKGSTIKFFGLEALFLLFGFFAATGFSHFVYGNDQSLFLILGGLLPTPFNTSLAAAYLFATAIFFVVGNLLVITVARGRRHVYGGGPSKQKGEG